MHRLKVIIIVVLCFVGGSGFAAEDLLSSRDGREIIFDALVDTVRDNYWDENYLDWDDWAERYREPALAATSPARFNAVLGRMINALADEHSRWVGRVTIVEDERDLSPEPSRPGLGFSHDYIRGVGVLVERVYPTTPAYQAGLLRGDVIMEVNGDDMRNFTNAAQRNPVLRNAIDSGSVVVTVKRKLEQLELVMVPGPIRFAAVSSLPEGRMLSASTGYIYIPTFDNGDVASKIHQLVAELQLQGASALVLDLRGNPGGRLSELGLMLGAFIDDGVWAQAVSRGQLAWQSEFDVDVKGQAFHRLSLPDGSISSLFELHAAPVKFTGELVVLVDRGNSSAGEIAPLVLQGFERATVIGEQTGGNVEAVRGFDLPDGSIVMIAVANVQSFDGRSFDSGVTPDVLAVESTTELGRGYDAPVAEALKFLQALPFTPGKYF